MVLARFQMLAVICGNRVAGLKRGSGVTMMFGAAINVELLRLVGLNAEANALESDMD